MTDEPTDRREISPFCDSQQNIRCPSCHQPHSFQQLNQEGGRQCEGCGRNIILKIESFDKYGEWRNVPKSAQHKYR